MQGKSERTRRWREAGIGAGELPRFQRTDLELLRTYVSSLSLGSHARVAGRGRPQGATKTSPAAGNRVPGRRGHEPRAHWRAGVLTRRSSVPRHARRLRTAALQAAAYIEPAWY